MIDHLDIDLFLIAEETSVRSVDTTRLTGNGTTYACAVPTRDTVSRLLRVVDGTFPPFDPAELRDEAHCTLVYSKKAGIDPGRLAVGPGQLSLEARMIRVEYWDGHNNTGYVVLKLDSPDMTALHRRFVEAGAKHSFDDYTPHLTIGAKVGEKTPEMERWLKRVNGVVAGAKDFVLEFDAVRAEDIRDDK